VGYNIGWTRLSSFAVVPLPRRAYNALLDVDDQIQGLKADYVLQGHQIELAVRSAANTGKFRQQPIQN
jgi:hypothetical protein